MPMSVVEAGKLKYIATGDHGRAITIATTTHDAAMAIVRSALCVASA